MTMNHAEIHGTADDLVIEELAGNASGPSCIPCICLTESFAPRAGEENGPVR